MEFNKGAEKLFGWKKEEVINKENIAMTIIPEDKKTGVQEWMSKRTRTEGLCELEMTRVRKNGERFPVLTTVTAIMDPSGKSSGFVEIIRDITVRKKPGTPAPGNQGVLGAHHGELGGRNPHHGSQGQAHLCQPRHGGDARVCQGGNPRGPHLEVLRPGHAAGQRGHGSSEGFGPSRKFRNGSENEVRKDAHHSDLPFSSEERRRRDYRNRGHLQGHHGTKGAPSQAQGRPGRISWKRRK